MSHQPFRDQTTGRPRAAQKGEGDEGRPQNEPGNRNRESSGERPADQGGLVPGTNSGPPKEDSLAKKQQHIALY